MRSRPLFLLLLLASASLALASPSDTAAEAVTTAASEPAPAMAEPSSATSVPADGIEQAARPYCGTPEAAADFAGKLLLEGYDVIPVVRDVILACGAGAAGPEVAAAVAGRALHIKGESAGYLIDAGVLAAASEMARRQSEPVVAAASAPQEATDRDLERERLRRMMEKGLLDDAYREYIEEQRGRAEEVAPAAVPTPYSDWDTAVYATLYTLGLVSGGFYDPIIDVGADPGGSASLR
jgi:hypothetical protein